MSAVTGRRRSPAHVHPPRPARRVGPCGAVFDPGCAYLMGMPELNTWPERALLGALVMTPTARPPVAVVVARDDLVDPWHRDVYTILAENPEADLVGVAQALQDRVGPLRADLPRLHSLVHDLPLTTDADAWARLVLEASLRRQVAQAAVLVQAAHVVGPTGQAQVRAVTSTVRGLLAGLRERCEQALPGRLTAAQTPLAAVEQERALLDADRVLADRGPDDVAEARDVEVRFIGSLFSHQGRILPWADHIRPEWLTAREWAPVLAALQRRAELGEALDVVSVSWEVQRTIPSEGPGPGYAAVNAAAEDWCWLDPDPLGRRIAHDLVRRGAENAAASIRTAAHNPAVTLPDLLHTVEVMLQAIDWAAEPLTDRPLPDVHPAPPLEPPAPGPPVPSPAIGW